MAEPCDLFKDSILNVELTCKIGYTRKTIVVAFGSTEEHFFWFDVHPFWVGPSYLLAVKYCTYNLCHIVLSQKYQLDGHMYYLCIPR